jgi:hypothetical protein
MTQLEATLDPRLTRPPRSRHSSGRAGVPLPLYVWPVAAMVMMLPSLVVLIVALVT